MKKISLIAAAMFAAVTSMPAAHAEYTPNVQFSGYMRSGIQHGSSAFTTKRFVKQVGRLGNENDTYGEIGLGSDIAKVDDTTFSVFTMIATGSDEPNGDAHDDDWNSNVAVRQYFVNVNGLIDSDKDANIWIGKRYYKREDTHINDFYYYNISGFGTGIDTLSVGPGKINLAWTRVDKDVSYTQKAGYTDSTEFVLDKYKNNEVVTKKANQHEPKKVKVNYFDARYELPAWTDANLQFGATYLNVEKDERGYYKTYDTAKRWKDALNLSAELNQGFSSGWNKTVLQVFTGSSATDAHWGDASGVSTDSGTGYRFINTGDFHFTDHFGFQHVVTAAYSSGVQSYDNTKSFSAVVRPFYQLTKMTRLVAEAGAYVQKVKNNDGDSLTERANKYTLAYAIAPNAADFWSRPELRFYVSYVNGSDTTSPVGPSHDGFTKTSDLMFGAQVEAWW